MGGGAAEADPTHTHVVRQMLTKGETDQSRTTRGAGEEEERVTPNSGASRQELCARKAPLAGRALVLTLMHLILNCNENETY